MGIKLGPKLELSFWAIGYIVLALTLLIINISWIAGSLDGILHGMKERNVFTAETTLPTAEYVDAIQKLLSDPTLAKAKRESLTARAARLSYNLGKVDTARTLYGELTQSANPDVKTRAQISIITMDLESVPDKAGDSTAKLTAATEALTKLNALLAENQNSPELLAARGAVLMYWFGNANSDAAVDQVRKLVQTARTQEKAGNPGNVEARRNILLMDLALRNYDPPETDEAAVQANNFMRLEAKKVAPYIKDVQESPLSKLLKEIDEKVSEGALGPPTLSKIPSISGLSAQEFSDLVNTVAPGAAASLNTPNGSQNLTLTLALLKRAVTSDAANQLTYENIAAMQVRYAMLQNEELNKQIELLRARNAALPAPFGNGAATEAAISRPISEMEKALADAYATLSMAVAENRLPTEPKAGYCHRMTQIALWRAALTVETSRKPRFTEALSAANLWMTFEPKNTDMMMTTAAIYEMMNDSENQTVWLKKLQAAGVSVSGLGPVTNRLDFITLYPANPLQIGTSDCIRRDKAVLVGCTFVVSGYTNPVDAGTVRITLNGKNLNLTGHNGAAFCLVPAADLTAQNKLDFKLALSPQLQKAASTVFKFESK